LARDSAVLVACLDGLIFDHLVGAGSLDFDEHVWRWAIRAILAQMIGGS
jgi:hypothetical protein